MLNFFILVNLIILCPIIIYGIIIAFINKKNASNLKRSSKWWLYTALGFIGTPIHELSHLIFNLLFFHKITEVALYRPKKSKKDGVLGYVNFTYNQKSIYQNIGLFFSGIAPMIGGCAVLFLLMKLLPDVFGALEYTTLDKLDIIDILLKLKNNMLININYIFTKYNSLQNLIIFIVLSFAISTHMHISTQDLKNATIGLIILEILFFVISIFLKIFNLNFLTNFLLIVASYMISFFTMGLIFSLISLGISYVIYLISN